MRMASARSAADLLRMAEILKVPYYSVHGLTEGRRIVRVVRTHDLWRPSPPAFDL